ncbi:beta-ketoacyl-ACP synthase II [Desulfocurvibacter africanus]|uniref:3-oxoacyl-[acyl-carrier-protein] synthase 2 n=1 Tax=Desulfocurvibacter africanus subsp. africanus str. Walvis Bay TaxID=690850 RepID=F3YXW9_DESAF|nr:beta-ketoacyl-ACP synthase II [Desulfocurvibacter africanus]EGJ50671.1 3-oxoacyl-(acyl-carrier-protein) synthase 2 [Desulfocurvibacter africanus subsp. africanus str. Walvis Bay]
MIGNRVVVTGLSTITPLGNDLETTWRNMLAGKSGVGPITQFDTTNFATKIAGSVKGFDPEQYMDIKQARRMDTFTQYAVACSKMLMDDSGFEITPDNADRVGTMIGVGLGGLHTIEVNHSKMLQSGPKRITPFFIPVLIANMAAGQVSIFLGARGPNLCTTSACASGLHAIGYAYTDIMLGRADAFICGGSESTITSLGIAGFNVMKALSTRNDDPERASRPFDRDRDGFVMGEGCGLMLLESLETAKARGAKILAEVVGFGASADAYHMAAPPENGDGMARSMRATLKEANVEPSVVAHINCHATSTPAGDMCEVRAIKTVFGEHAPKIALTANKSLFGHLLGGAGGVETVIMVKSMVESLVPPTINLENPDPEMDLDCVTATRKLDMPYALSNSFGFGGTNCSVLMKKFDG